MVGHAAYGERISKHERSHWYVDCVVVSNDRWIDRRWMCLFFNSFWSLFVQLHDNWLPRMDWMRREAAAWMRNGTRRTSHRLALRLANAIMSAYVSMWTVLLFRIAGSTSTQKSLGDAHISVLFRVEWALSKDRQFIMIEWISITHSSHAVAIRLLHNI